jgi:hypothetical protein
MQQQAQELLMKNGERFPMNVPLHCLVDGDITVL